MFCREKDVARAVQCWMRWSALPVRTAPLLLEVLILKRLFSLYSLIAIVLAAGAVNLHAQTVAVDKGSLTFSAQFGGATQSQTLNVTSSTGAAISFNASSNANWLTVNGLIGTSGTTPSTLTVAANPTGLNPGTYNATVSVFGAANTASNPVSVGVTLTISTIGVSPSSITFTGYTAGSTTVPAAQTITLSGPATSFNATATTLNGGTWLQVAPASGTSPATITAALNTAIVPGLAVGSYQGKITVTPAGGSTNIPVDIPVTLTVSAAPVVTVTPSPLQFSLQQPGGTNNITSQVMTIAVTPASQLGFGLISSVDPNPAGKNWITTNPPAGNTNAQTGLGQITVGVDSTNLPAGTYTGKITVMTPGGTPAQQDVAVKLVISATALLNIPASPLTFTAQLNAAAPAAQSVNITATSGTIAYTAAVATASGGAWLSAPATGTTAAPLSISVNPAGLAPGTYTGTVTIASSPAGSGTQVIPVTLKVSNDPAISTNLTALSFPFQIGQAIPPAQLLKITSSTGAPLSFTATPTLTSCAGSPWLQLNGSAGTAPSGSTDASLVVSVNPAGLPAGTCTGKITINATVTSTGVAAINSPLDIPVTLYVSNTPLLVVNPSQPVAFSVALGSQSATPQTIGVASTSNAAADQLNYSVSFQTNNGGPWLAITPLTGTTPGNLSVLVTPGLLSAGTYSGTVTITATTAGVANSPVTVPVTLTVSAGSLTLSATSMNFTSTVSGTAPAAQTVTVGSSGAALSYNAVAATTTSPSWLSVTPASGTTAANPTLTISADPSKLTAGTYNGTVTVSSPGAGNSPATINVVLTVQPGTLSAPTTTLTFTQVAGGTPPAAQTIAVTGSPSALNFTAAPSANTPWLAVNPASGTTPGNVQVTVNGSTLAIGQYTGNVVLTSTGAAGSPITVPVVLNVVGSQTLSATPASLTFINTLGLAAPPPQSLAIAITGAGAPITATVAATPAAPWLTVTPGTATAPATLTVKVSPTGLAPGTYTGNITVSSSNALNALTIPVTFTVSAVPKPVVSAIGNAASYSTGAVSPGENIVIFGTGVGPDTLVSGTVTAGILSSTVATTRVLFDGVAAPIIYASATQTSVMVPYGVNGRTTTSVVVEYSGVQSNAIAYNVASAAPGVYTMNQQGNGPGAVLNQDGVTVNSSSAPAARGSVISVYMTGEGSTAPAGTDGAIIPAVASALKSPVLPVTATINGITAQVLYAGSAPGIVSGVMQVNVVIPSNAPVGGAVPLVITVGTSPSQSGVTIAVQ